MQDILYLHTRVNSLTSDILAMRIMTDGQISDGPENPDDWPYKYRLGKLRVVFAKNEIILE